MLTGAWPDVADAVNEATGAWFGGGGEVAVMVCVTEPVAPWLSVTVRVTV